MEHSIITNTLLSTSTATSAPSCRFRFIAIWVRSVVSHVIRVTCSLYIFGGLSYSGVGFSFLLDVIVVSASLITATRYHLMLIILLLRIQSGIIILLCIRVGFRNGAWRSRMFRVR